MTRASALPTLVVVGGMKAARARSTPTSAAETLRADTECFERLVGG